MVERFKPLGSHLYIDHIYRHVTEKYYCYHRRNFEGRARGVNAATFFYIFYFFAYEDEEGNWKIGVRVEDKDVCIFRSGSNQSSPLSNLTPSEVKVYGTHCRFPLPSKYYEPSYAYVYYWSLLLYFWEETYFDFLYVKFIRHLQISLPKMMW